MNPTVSIGMPVFNDAAFIPAALNSLLNQSFADFELIISDDGSTDGSEAICRGYAARDSRVRYIRQPVNLGISRNMMFLLEQARGEYFMWAGDDDLYDPRFIASLLDALRSSEDAISAFTPMQLIDEAGLPYPNSLIRHSDYSGATSAVRIKKLIKTFDDGFGYGLFHRESIEGVRFPTWWWVNKRRAYNNIYPTLCFYLAKGNFVLVGSEPMFFKRLKNRENINHNIPYSHSFVKGYLAFWLWKVNLVVVSLRQISRAGKPWTAVRLFPRMTVWWILAATKREWTYRWPRLKKREISFFLTVNGRFGRPTRFLRRRAC